MNYFHRYFGFTTILTLSIAWASCKQQNNTITLTKDEHEQLNEDSLELLAAYELQSKITHSVQPSVETEPVNAGSTEDAADDPAIWYNQQNPSKSLIYGSNKKGGLIVTNLEGKKVNHYDLGSINNVDIHYKFAYNDSYVTLLGCSNRSTQAINLFIIQPGGDLNQLRDPSFAMDSTRIDDIYGFCFGRENNKSYVFINGKNGLMQQYLINSEQNKLKLELVREVQFDSQTEGMVADNVQGNIYVGEENRGIWMLNMDPSSNSKVMLVNSGEENANIVYDIEGITLYRKAGTAFLIASSQGNFSYAVFDINNKNNYLGSFKIMGGSKIDGVEETDGIDINSDSLNVNFPKGIFVAQDGFNYNDDAIVPQNFKYVGVDDILSLIKSY